MKIIHQFIFPLCVSPWHTPLSSCRASRERWSMCNIPHWLCCGAESEQSPLLLAALWKLQSNVQTSNVTQWNIRQTLSNFVMTSSRVGSITCRRRWAEVGALWCCWTRLGRLGELGTVVILALRRLRFPLWLRQKKVSHVSYCYCLYFSMEGQDGTGCGGFVIWSLRISIASSWGSGFFVKDFPSPFLHTLNTFSDVHGPWRWEDIFFRVNICVTFA